jgi:type II secretory pathway component PulK
MLLSVSLAMTLAQIYPLNSFYEERTPSHKAANQEVAHVSELMAVKGFSEEEGFVYHLLLPKRFSQISEAGDESPEPEEGAEFTGEPVNDEQEQYDEGNLLVNAMPFSERYWGGVRHYVSALPAETKINVNTAPVEVLQTLFSSEEAGQIISGREGSPYQKVEDIFLNLEGIKNEDKSKYLPYLDVRSEYFKSTVIATIDETSFVLRSTLYRDDKGRVRVISREFTH